MTDLIYLAVIAVPVLVALALVFGNPDKQRTKISRIFFLAAIFVFTYLPIAVLIIFSFNEGRSTGVWEGFSLKWYRELFADERIIHCFRHFCIYRYLLYEKDSEDDYS